MNYEQLRAKVADAVIIALPIDPAPPHHCITHFEYNGATTADTNPVWGPPEGLVEAIVNEVMQVLFPDPVVLPTTTGGRNATQLYEPDSCPDGEACSAFIMRHVHPIPPKPSSTDLPAMVSGRWGCGCTTKECNLLWDTFRDAGTDPSQNLRVTCTTHSLRASSEPARVADNEGMRQKAQALYKLDLAHQEQCR